MVSTDELAELVRGLRAHVAHHHRGGVYATPVPVPVPVPGPVSDSDPPARTRLTLADIRADLGDCQRCKLCQTRNKIVFGNGSETAPIMFVGEGPGADEDRL